jgi:hypothetical protein
MSFPWTNAGSCGPTAGHRRPEPDPTRCGHNATATANIAIATTKAANATGIQILVVIIFVSPDRWTRSTGSRPPRAHGGRVGSTPRTPPSFAPGSPAIPLQGKRRFVTRRPSARIEEILARRGGGPVAHNPGGGAGTASLHRNRNPKRNRNRFLDRCLLIPLIAIRLRTVDISISPELRHWIVPRVWTCWLPRSGWIRRIPVPGELNRPITITITITIRSALRRSDMPRPALAWAVGGRLQSTGSSHQDRQGRVLPHGRRLRSECRAH